MRKAVYQSKETGFFEWILIILLVGFYPLLVAVHSMLPPLIGVVGLIIIYNLNKNKLYALLGVLYLINIDLNLSLPLLLSSFSILFIYFVIFPSACLMIRCKTCLSLFLVVFVDAFYYMNLFIYDIVFSSNTITGDATLIFYIMIDLLIGFFL